MRKERLLQDLEKAGYDITLETKGTTVFVTLNSKTAEEPYTLLHQYNSEDFTNYEIKLDTVYDLLEWSGMRHKRILTY